MKNKKSPPDFKLLTDEQHYKLLEEFANQHSIVVGGNIKVSANIHSICFKPIDKSKGMRYEDTQYLDSVIRGANQFIFFMRR